MYNCRLCGTTSPAGQPMFRHVIHRRRKNGHREIAAEYPICAECREDIDAGVSPRLIYEEFRRQTRNEGHTIVAVPQPRGPLFFDD